MIRVIRVSAHHTGDADSLEDEACKITVDVFVDESDRILPAKNFGYVIDGSDEHLYPFLLEAPPKEGSFGFMRWGGNLKPSRLTIFGKRAVINEVFARVDDDDTEYTYRIKGIRDLLK